MRITAIELFRLAVPLRRPIRTSVHDFSHANTVLVHMRTDAGLTGTGWCFAPKPTQAAALAALVEDLAQVYDGRDPRAVRANHAAAWTEMNWLGHAGAPMMALAALDTACWDIAAQAADLPLYRFLGGEKDRVETYASSALWRDRTMDALIAEAEDLIGEGHRAMKLRVGQADVSADVARARQLREALGPDMRILVDANQAWAEADAIRAGRGFEEHDIYWLEEPVFYADLEGCARVAAALDMRVATGETSYGAADMTRHLELRAADVLMPDLQRMGGITQYLDVCALCAAHHEPVSSHLFTEASAHVLAAQPHALMLEHMDWWDPLFAEPVRIEDGAVVIPDRPGLGLELAPNALTKYAA